VKIKHPSDEILIARVAQGDTGALEILYDRHAAMVLGILVRILGERAASEELLQETFFQVWKRAATYSPQTGSLTGWVFQIARGLAVAESNGK
jgi:RNA polymerase sigma-70 factor, ECF subfamily